MLSTVEFVRRMLEVRPPICPPQCRGFHKTKYLRFNPDGTVEFQDSPYGFHSVVYPHPSFNVVGFDEAVRIIEEILQEQESLSGRRDDLAEVALLTKLELAYAS